jgi:hypothetical protein
MIISDIFFYNKGGILLMHKKMVIWFISVFFLNVLIPVNGIADYHIDINNASNPLFEDGWLEIINGIYVVHISGSFYEMGYQHGFLLKDEINENLRAFNNYYEQEKGIAFTDFLDLWNEQKNFVSQDIIDFTQGSADGANITFDEYAVSWVYGVEFLYKKSFNHHCSGFSAWGSATGNNELFCARSLDWFLKIKDPITGKYTQENPVLIVAKPDKGHAFMYPGVAGHSVSCGINEKGITITSKYSLNNKHTDSGSPLTTRIFQALYLASDIEEAIDIIDSNNTYGYNLIVSDGDIPIGYALEITNKKSYSGTWDDPVESIRPFLKIDNVVRRTNFFIDPDMSEDQRAPYNPGALRHFFGLMGGKPGIFLSWLHYRSLSKGIQRYWGDIDLNKSMQIIRDVYNLKYDIMWRYIINKWDCRYASLLQWAACPKTGGFLISFADVGKSAWECPVNYFNLFSLLQSDPI